jgi:hypothetical protein
MVPRTVADRLAFRLHLRPLNMDPGVFPPVAAPDRSAVGLFPLVALQSPTGTHLRHRTFSLPACALLVAIGSASHEVSFPSGALHPGNRLRGISRAGRALRHTIQQGPPIVRGRRCSTFAPEFATLHCPTADESVAVMRGLSRGCSGGQKLALLARCSETPLPPPAAGFLTHRSGRVETRPARLRVRAAVHPEVSDMLSPPHRFSDAPGSMFRTVM